MKMFVNAVFRSLVMRVWYLSVLLLPSLHLSQSLDALLCHVLLIHKVCTDTQSVQFSCILKD